MMWPHDSLHRRTHRHAMRRRRQVRLWTLERMEDRTLLATFTVINTNDNGGGSLRQALVDAYDSYVHGDTDNTVVFNIPETDPGKDPSTGAFVIRPLSTLGQGAPVVIDGYSQPGSSRNTLAVGDNAVLRIELDGSQAGDGAYGLYLNHTDNCTVEGMDIHSFSGAGIDIDGGGNNVVVGNFIGTDITGTEALGNGLGVGVGWSDGNRFGGDDPSERNIISGNGLGSGQHGIAILGSNNSVVGNYIGTDKTGTQPLGNGHFGVSLAYDGSGNQIERNVIADNPAGGIGIQETRGHHLIAGNDIGTDINGQPLGRPQDSAIYIGNDSYDQIGGSPVLANTITNTGIGVEIADDASTGISIRCNSIFGTRVGIDFGPGGRDYYASGSDPLDGDTGPNNLQNFPVLSAAIAGATTRVTGRMNSVPSMSFTLDFYANAIPGFEGRRWLGSTTVMTDANGDVRDANGNLGFNIPGLGATTPGEWVSATATDPNGNTSEFSYFDVQTIKADTTTAITSSVTPSLLNQTVTFTATVAATNPDYGTPTSSVQFLVDGSNFGAPVPLVAGAASLSTSALSVGAHTIAGTYLGDSSFNSSSSGSLAQTVNYAFSGFLPPLSTGVSYALGRTIPIKFQLADYNGAAVTGAAAVTGLQILPVNPGGAAFSPVSTDGKGLTFSGGQFQFNWQTKDLAAGSYQIQLSLADGTTQTKTIQLASGGGAAGLLADTTCTSAAATAGALLGGNLTIAVNDPNGLLTADEQARISDAISRIDQVVAPYGVTMTQVDPSSGPADVTIDTSSTSAVGGYADGVLGCESGTEVTLIQGWSWYAGADPAAIQAGQFDFETVVMHELGHVLGLGHSANPTSVMYATLGAGAANRNLAVADLNVPDADGGAPAGLHARVSRPIPMPAAASPTPGPNVGLMAWDLAVADLSWSGLNQTQRKRT